MSSFPRNLVENDSDYTNVCYDTNGVQHLMVNDKPECETPVAIEDYDEGREYDLCLTCYPLPKPEPLKIWTSADFDDPMEIVSSKDLANLQQKIDRLVTEVERLRNENAALLTANAVLDQEVGQLTRVVEVLRLPPGFPL